MIIAEQNWQPMIDDIWRNRQIEDYDGSSTHSRNFVRSWNHSRTAKHISIEELMKSGEKVDGDILFEIEDPRSQFEEKVVGEMQIEQFKAGLTERDKIILRMRAEKYTLQEIADKVGFKTPSAVKKHLAQITGNYESFVQNEYSAFLDKHTK